MHVEEHDTVYFPRPSWAPPPCTGSTLFTRYVCACALPPSNGQGPIERLDCMLTRIQNYSYRHTSYRKDIMHGKALICACVWVWPDSIYTHHAFWIAEKLMITIAHTNSTQLHHIYTTHHAHMQSVTGWPIKTKPGRKEPVSRANNYGFCLHLPVWVLLLLSPSVEIIIWFLL